MSWPTSYAPAAVEEASKTMALLHDHAGQRAGAGACSWAWADGVLSLPTPDGRTVRLALASDDARALAAALLRVVGGELPPGAGFLKLRVAGSVYLLRRQDDAAAGAISLNELYAPTVSATLAIGDALALAPLLERTPDAVA